MPNKIRNKFLIYSFIFIFLVSIAFSREYTQDYLNFLTRGVADNIYCMQEGNCILNNLTVKNYTILNSSVINGSFELYGDLDMNNYDILNIATMYMGVTDTDQYIYFYDSGNPTREYIKWDDGFSWFRMSDSLYLDHELLVQQGIDVNGGDIWLAGGGDLLINSPLSQFIMGSTTWQFANFVVFADGTMIVKNQSYFHGDVLLNNNTYVNGTMYVNGSAYFKGDVQVEGITHIKNQTLIDGNLTVSGYSGFGTTPGDNRVDVSGDIHLIKDHDNLKFAWAEDAYIDYDGFTLNINPRNVGTGNVAVEDGDLWVYFGDFKVFSGDISIPSNHGELKQGDVDEYSQLYNGNHTIYNLTRGNYYFHQGGLYLPEDNQNFTLGDNADHSVYYDGTHTVLEPHFNVGGLKVATDNLPGATDSICIGRVIGSSSYPGITNCNQWGVARGAAILLTSANTYINADGTIFQRIDNSNVFTVTGTGIHMQGGDDIWLNSDTSALYGGASGDSVVYYNGFDLILRGDIIGSGMVKVKDDFNVTGTAVFQDDVNITGNLLVMGNINSTGCVCGGAGTGSYNCIGSCI